MTARIDDPVRALTARTGAILQDLLPDGPHVALLDFPAHDNAGDSLIHLGQMAHLRRLGLVVRYLADDRTYSPTVLRKRHPDGPIFIQGGGNLGDLWPLRQDFRERLLREHPDRAIVQLPQSMDFRDPARLARASAAFHAHPDLTLLLRDERSLQRARDAFPGVRVEFCPDLAPGAGPQPRTGPATHDVLLLLRTDGEQTGDHRVAIPPGATALRTDWGFRGADRVRWDLLRAPSAIARHVPVLRGPMQGLVERSFAAIAAHNVDTARAVLSRGRVVVTDRLHAAVLAALMGIPVIALDNCSGKISAAYDAYLHALPGLTFAGGVAEASEALEKAL
ncbi:polysaccharide pyruvyl transferase family protein [Catenuloplanes atrovinosus]|uniref:Pyruvyl transferase EpsO n=1 Tax=Catenuloplanes atrovinosus TaxID=137266 RepID=A0AAE3YSF3_9ACTN|nr:polysaccharide pyruvyl transferase family protein [Catenuloplanes atrovinosus]MDR7279049.1 pyruvyl transferase EpsO [Catenuloplanes atrovinosus]